MQFLGDHALRRHIVILTFALAVVLGSTLAAVKITTDYLLYQNATSAARNWGRLFAQSVEDLDRIAAGDAPSSKSTAFLDWAKRTGRMHRWEIYDRQGKLKLASEQGAGLADPTKSGAHVGRALKTNAPVVDLREGTSPGEPPFYAKAFVPVAVDGTVAAVVGTYVDQTERRAQFHRAFLKAAVSLCLLSGLAFAIPAAAWFRRTKEKQEADRHILDSVKRGDALAEQAKAQHERFEAALTNMPHGLCMFDKDKRLVISNARYAEMYKLPPRLVGPGTPLKEIIDYRHQIGNAPLEFPNYVTHDGIAFQVGDNSVFEFGLEDGRTIRINHLALSGGGYFATHEDVTEAVRAEARISHMARHDALTNLPNRAFFRETLERAVKSATPDRGVTVLCLDLDHFKAVNDTFGHPMGDTLLSAVSRRLRGCVKADDTVARLGGDEFAIVRPGSDPAGAAELAQGVIEAVGGSYELDGHSVVIGTSVGIATAPEDGESADELLKNADMALYRAKSNGRGSHCFFEPTMDATMQARRRMEIGLRRALVNEEFELHYQALVNAQSHAVTGFEALLRWRDPERGLVPPGEFVPLAEETGMIVPIGDWVIRRACADAANWPRNLSVAVNLSPVQFKGRHVVTMVFGALAASQLLPSRLELEITESVLLNKTDDTVATLPQLRDFGVRISMDDFGTGYSSLSYLRSFPFDKIKIDQSFIRDLTNSDDSLAIVRAVAGLGAALGVTTTAEGVETPEQLACLRREGCTEVQGYLFGRPLPAAQLEDYFSDPKWLGATPQAEVPQSERRPRRAAG